MYNKVKALCDEKGITVVELEHALGFKNGTIGHWRESLPRCDRAMRVANYFDVDINDLMGNERLSPNQKEVVELFPRLSEEDQELMLAQIRTMIRMSELN